MGCCQSCCGKKAEKPSVRTNGNIPVCLPLPVNEVAAIPLTEVVLDLSNEGKNYHVVTVDVDKESTYSLTESYRSSIISSHSLFSRQEIIEKEAQIDPSYAANVLKALNDMRLNEFMTDLTIVVGGEGFPCHRAVIAAATPIWASIFLENEDVREFELSDYGPDIISRVIEFVYTSKLTLSNRNVEDILEVVRDLKMGAAEHACQEYLATAECTEASDDENGPVSEHVFQQPLHAVEILLKLNSQRGGRKFTDCAINLENDEVLPCHRIVMCTGGEYFREVFSETRMKSQLDDNYAAVTLKSNACIKAMVDFTYTSRLDVEESNAIALYKAASAVQHPGVLRKCGNFLRRKLRPDNCLGIWALARNHGDKLLLKSARRMALKRFAEVVGTSDEFRQLSKEDVMEYLGQDGLFVKSEESVYKAVLTWLNYDQLQRSQFFPELLPLCRLSFCSPTFIDSLLNEDSSKLFSNDQSCRELCEGAIAQQAVNRNGKFEKDPRPRPRFSYEKSEIMVAIGGATKNESWTQDLIYYNPQDQQWYVDGLFAPLATEVIEYTTCVLLNDIYVIGGIWKNGSVSNEVFRYNILFDEWTQTGRLQTARWRHGAGVMGRKIYAVGGQSSGKSRRIDDSSSFLNSVERYSRQTDSWETIQPLPYECCCKPVVSSYKSKLYVFGSGSLANYQCFDAKKNAWTTVKSEESLTVHHPRAAVNLKEKIYIIGGRNQFSVDIFDAEVETVKSGTSLDHDHDHVRDSYSVAYTNGKIYVTGGRWEIGADEEDPLVIMTNGVDVYDPALDSWSVLRPMPKALIKHGLVTVKKYINNKIQQN